jgi:hypothetical protein
LPTIYDIALAADLRGAWRAFTQKVDLSEFKPEPSPRFASGHSAFAVSAVIALTTAMGRPELAGATSGARLIIVQHSSSNERFRRQVAIQRAKGERQDSAF